MYVLLRSEQSIYSELPSLRKTQARTFSLKICAFERNTQKLEMKIASLVRIQKSTPGVWVAQKRALWRFKINEAVYFCKEGGNDD